MVVSVLRERLNSLDRFGLVVSVIIPFLAFVTVLMMVPLVCRLADRAGFVDAPAGRKQHDVPVPPLGGVVIFTVFLSFMVWVGGLPWAVFAALALMLVAGIIDDARELNAKLKFALHFTSAFIMVLGGGAQIHSLGNLLGFGDINLGWMAIPFSVACIVYIQNALNMMDGVDGLAGGQSFLVFAWLMFAALGGGNSDGVLQLSLLMACVAGFLVYNMRSPLLKRAKIFLGDAGSMALGLMIAWYAITLSQGHAAVIRPASVAWLIALPIVDSFGLLVARLKDKKPPFAPDRRHFHHHFAAAGFSAGQTTVLILSYSACLGAIGFFGVRLGVPDFILGWAWVALWMAHTLLTVKSEKFIQLLVAARSRIQHQ